jgi:non-ribosomal peptide synthetase component F
MNDISGAMNRMQVNIALITPSFVRLIDPASVPMLKTLFVGGEKLVQDDLDSWVGRVRFIEAYGPSECCVMCIGNEISSKDTNPSHIGTGFLGSYVILDGEMELVQPGSVGELCIGGPHLARGYLNDPIKTAASFVPTPSCIQKNTSCERWHKTGGMFIAPF